MRCVLDMDQVVSLCVIVILCLSQGANELAVTKAKAEITRLIKEELIRLVSAINYTIIIIIIHIITNWKVSTTALFYFMALNVKDDWPREVLHCGILQFSRVIDITQFQTEGGAEL